ncbi:hypothetical protein K1T71_011824 [Dendrolimus kikuchii]|uniref:Uncharacterized protein n=1 Tax=Dendrolimus kikuchii TaxID=765133 RepID=A0ACC1CM45_9NEOP|nr:hypothetical protein K1T71_011824 [Dendrolimus kikuchii]
MRAAATNSDLTTENLVFFLATYLKPTHLLQLNQENRERLQREREELKTMILPKNNEESLDDMDHFFLSMARNLKKRSPFLLLQAKRKIINIVLEAEDFEIQNTSYQNYGYSSAPITSNQDNNGNSAAPEFGF